MTRMHQQGVTSIRLRGTLCYPPGAGGHFLLSMVTGRRMSVDARTNDHKAADLLWLELEDLQDPYYRLGLADADDELRRRADEWERKLASHGPYLHAAMHYLPKITTNMYDFYTEELVQMTVSDSDLTFVRLLDWIKLNLKREEQQPHKVADLINQVLHSDIPSVDLHHYRRSIASIEPLLGGLPLTSTMFGWMHYTWCMGKQRDPGDAGSLRAYIDNVLKDYLRQPYRQSDVSDALPSTTYGTWRRVDWAALMLDGDLPREGMLSGISRIAVNDYMRRNIATVDGLMEMLPDSVRAQLVPYINAATKRLDAW